MTLAQLGKYSRASSLLENLTKVCSCFRVGYFYEFYVPQTGHANPVMLLI